MWRGILAANPDSLNRELTMTKTVRLPWHAMIAGLVVILPAAPTKAEEPPTLEWIRQSGRPNYDYHQKVAVAGSGALYVIGAQSTPEAIGSISIAQKHDPTGAVLWTHSVGSAANRVYLTDVETDNSENLYFAGFTFGSFTGANAGPAGYSDAILRKLNPTGAVVWSKQIGISGSDTINSLRHDGLGNVYFAGTTQGSLAGPHLGEGDAILGKYDTDGNLLWSRQFGGPLDDSASAVATDPMGSVLVAGASASDLGGPIGSYLAKYDPDGNQLWLRQYGSAVGSVTDIATDGLGNVFALETKTTGEGAAGRAISVIKFDGSGAMLWSRFIGTWEHSFVSGLSADPLGNAYVSGDTSLNLGAVNAGGHDAFLRKYDAAGNALWTYQLGTDDFDGFHDVEADGQGNIVVVGESGGSLGNPNPAHSNDAIISLLRQSPVPEPCSVILASLGFAFLVERSRVRRAVRH